MNSEVDMSTIRFVLLVAIALAVACDESEPGKRSDGGAGDGDTSGDSDGSSPDGSSPDGSSPDGSSPDGSSPDGSSPDASSPDDAGTGGGLEDASIAPNMDDPRAEAFLETLGRGHLDSFATGTRPIVWSESANLEALTVVYEGTGDTRILDELMFHIDAILASTSEARGIVDELRGAPVAAWPTDGYYCDHLFAHAVHTGVMTYPMARFAQLVLSTPELVTTYGDSARAYVEAVDAALAVHAGQFRVTGDSGRYDWPDEIAQFGVCDGTDFADRPGTPLPFNMMLAVGRAHMALGRAMETLDDGRAANHLDRALRLARTFEDNLTAVDGYQGYAWDYIIGGRPEDASHASQCVRFTAQAHREGLYFDDAHMQRLVNTFLDYLALDPDHVRSHLVEDYGGVYERRWQQGAVRWLALSAVTRDVYDRGRYIYDNAEGDSVLGRALLLKWDPDVP